MHSTIGSTVGPTLHAFEQFGALYVHNHDAKYASRPGFEPDTPRLQAPVDTNEPSGPATCYKYVINVSHIKRGLVLLMG